MSSPIIVNEISYVHEVPFEEGYLKNYLNIHVFIHGICLLKDCCCEVARLAHVAYWKVPRPLCYLSALSHRSLSCPPMQISEVCLLTVQIFQ